MPRGTERDWRRLLGFILGGQTVSMFGSRLTRFALGVWVFQRSHSTVDFASVLLFASLPGVLLMPFAAVYIDRYPRKLALLACDVGAGLVSVTLALLLFKGWVTLPVLYPIVFLSSFFDSVRTPALTAATSLLVPPEQLARANGMVQAGESLARVGSPVLAGILLGPIGLAGTVVIDCATFLVAVLTLLLTKFPELAEGTRAGCDNVWKEAIQGWDFVRSRRGLLAFLVLVGLVNLNLGIFQALFSPMVLSFADEKKLGLLMSIAGLGMLCGGLVMSVWGGPRKKMRAVLGFGAAAGLTVSMTGLSESIPFIALVVFFYLFCQPIVNGCSMAIWQRKVESRVQGRVFATMFMIVRCTEPLAFVVAGPVAERVFEPLLKEGGSLRDSVGSVIGIGAGRGIGLLFILLGLLMALLYVLSGLHRDLREVEARLPDALTGA